LTYFDNFLAQVTLALASTLQLPWPRFANYCITEFFSVKVY